MLDHPGRRPLRTATLLVAGTLSFGVLACSTATPDRADLTDALVTSGLPRTVAQCASDALVSELSTDELDLLVERGNGGAPTDDPDRDDDAADRLRAALAGCQELLPTTTLAPAEPVVPSTGAIDPAPTSTTVVRVPTSEDGPRLEPGPSSSSTSAP